MSGCKKDDKTELQFILLLRGKYLVIAIGDAVLVVIVVVDALLPVHLAF